MIHSRKSWTLMSAVFVFACCWLTTAHAQQLNLASTKLVFSTGVPDTLCANSQVNVCGKLTQTCPGGPDMPLVGRPIIFFVNPGNCGNNVAVNGDDTVLTDVNGIACATLTIPNTVGNYAIRIKFLGESKPGPSDPPNSACDTTDRVSLSASNECETFIVTQTAPPIADNPATPVNLFQCVASQVCFQFTASGGGTLTWTKASGSGTLTAGGLWCFTPVSAGAYSISAIVANACGGADTTSLTYNITLNGPPVIAFGNDTTIFQCTPAQICLPYTVSDPQGLAKLTEVLISGSGTIDTANNRVCLTPPSAGSYQIIVSVTDSCGASDRDTIVVTVGLNSAPVAANPPSVTVFQCVAAQLCHTFTATDVNGGTLTWTKLSGTGTVTPAGLFCFTPSTSGSYNVVVTVADSCGAKDTTSISYTVTVNSNPVAVNPSTPVNLFQCTASQVCFQFTASDVNGGALIWSKASGSGTLTTGGLWCFTPVLAGAYSISAIVADSCGRADTTTLTYNITLNAPPVIAFGSDTTIFQCTPAQICLPYTVSDPQGLAKLTEVFISGYGAIDTLNNRVCFTPASAGSYQMIVSVTDSCGASDRDTIVVTVSTGAAADITCPVGPIPVSLCDTGQVCYALAITPAGATVTTNLGTYSAGQLCFTANASGTYNAQVIATTACGADTCNLVFNVTVGQAASITCPPSASKFICSADQVCLPMSVIGSGATVTVSPIGTYVAGQVCFQADSSGVYNLTVIASTSCGADTCQFTATVTINSAPIAVNPASPLNAFLCVAGQICNQFTATDVNGGTPTWTLLSGAGTVSSTGQWCFTASATGSYSVVAKVADSCGAADTVNMTVNVTINSAPVFSFGNDTTITQCAVAQICLPFTKSDPNGNIATIELLSGSGTLFAGTGLLCFVPSGEGTFQFIARAVDSCGAEDRDTINVTIDLNAPPLVTVANDTSIFLCAPAQICRTAFCSDPDNNLTTCELVSGPGALSGNNVCFTPNAPGVYTFIIKATDACGLTDLDTTKVTVTVNAPPLVTVANDTSIFLCAPAQICRTAFCSDPDNNLTTCELVSGPGALSGNNVCFTPNASGVYTFIIKATDACGLTDLDTTKVTVTVNNAPIANAGKDSTFFVCGNSTICWSGGCSDPNNNLIACEILQPAGATLSAGQICLPVLFGAGNDTSYTVIIKATDACGATDLDTAIININFNSPPVVVAPPDFEAFPDLTGQICFDVNISDPDNNIVSVLVSPVGVYSSGTGQVCFNADTSGVYCLIITATDACNAVSADTVCVTALCVQVQIEEVVNVIQGQYKDVSIFLNGSAKELAGYDLLISYDASALSLAQVTPGTAFLACGWEYFTFRFGPFGNCGSGCPSGIVRITAIADINNGANHPDCYLDAVVGSLAVLSFLVTNDRTLECQFSAISFYWIDCGDNGFSSVDGDTLWVSQNVFSAELDTITNNTYGFPGAFGIPNVCIGLNLPGKPAALRCVDFTNGGINIICADSIDGRGDINLDGLMFSISDAVMFTNYFVQGLGAFQNHVDGSIAASDVNADGNPLTVADLVYLIRIVVGDAPPVPKVDPNSPLEAEFVVANDMLIISHTDEPIGGLFILLNGKANPTLGESAKNMDIRYEFDGTHTRVLIFTMEGKSFLESGGVLKLDGAAIKSVEVGGFSGSVIAAKVIALPTEYSLSQNYPNPFNPVTTINFDLPKPGEWTITIYNLLGQSVETMSDTYDAGSYKVEWDAGKYASGIYFYRLTVGSFSATKKMVLLK